CVRGTGDYDEYFEIW
nr:immunoglobulin heavy chain junction region [Macaca mulatta]MOV42346.1 immunoglobulin heavy chain junction region [Macaca mulatta]MOV42921.1 immunoglobulin heavy chain junction region [Macaca mulatta]MOV44226.1 immunoglobulin heavy chain junction region [Macaca mulatta]